MYLDEYKVEGELTESLEFIIRFKQKKLVT